MVFPEFFYRTPTITLRDPLAELLGAAESGLIEYSFADAVKLTGHACPTVAGAWMMATQGLKLLYGDAIPCRGEIEVDFHEAEDSGVTGVMASVFTLLTGAAGKGGFKGLAGQFQRNDLLGFEQSAINHIRLTRSDNKHHVDCQLDLSVAPADPRTGPLLGKILAGNGTPATHQLFTELWLARVERILLDGSIHNQMLKFALSRSANSS